MTRRFGLAIVLLALGMAGAQATPLVWDQADLALGLSQLETSATLAEGQVAADRLKARFGLTRPAMTRTDPAPVFR